MRPSVSITGLSACILAASLFLAGGARAAETTAGAKADGASAKLSNFLGGSKEGQPTEVEIRSDNMDIDFQKHFSTFTGHVKVTESRMTLTADKMVVYFGQDDKPQRIECTGNVVIEQPEAKRRATAGRAEYDLAKGQISLTENPKLLIGQNSLEGVARITYYRDSERISCEGASGEATQPVIRLMPGSQQDIPGFPSTSGNKGK